MCVSCAVFSVLTLFMPGPQQPADLAPVNATNAQCQCSQVNTASVAKDYQVAIDGMLNKLPNTPDMRVLFAELKSIKAQLASVKNDAEAQSLIDDRFSSLSERLKAEPNYDKINAVLTAMLVEDEGGESSAKSLGWKILKRTNYSYSSIPLKTQGLEGKTWGWLHN